jgi:hypothetical protein
MAKNRAVCYYWFTWQSRFSLGTVPAIKHWISPPHRSWK